MLSFNNDDDDLCMHSTNKYIVCVHIGTFRRKLFKLQVIQNVIFNLPEGQTY